jgi:hypothetical protein
MESHTEEVEHNTEVCRVKVGLIRTTKVQINVLIKRDGLGRDKIAVHVMIPEPHRAVKLVR